MSSSSSNMTRNNTKGFSCGSRHHFSALGLLLLSASSIIHNCDGFMSTTTTKSASTQRWSTSITEETASSSSASSGSTYGPTIVDMNQYNLHIDDIANEWKAEIVPESSLREEGIYLGAKSSKEIMVDTFKIEFPRIHNQGLGIELLELAGGREDGLGITVINGLIDDGTAATGITHPMDLMIGDSISKIAIKRTTKTKKGDSSSSTTTSELSNVEEIESINVECFGYDKTVDAILNLPSQQTNEDCDESYVLTIKRLRRKPKVIVELQYPPNENEPPTTIELFSGENLRRAMLTRGIKLNDKYSRRFDSGGIGDCGAEGTCATCVVNVMEGMELLSTATQQESQILAKKPRYRMACRAIVGYGMQSGTMKIQVNPRQF